MEGKTHYKLLKIQEENHSITQRELAARLGINLGKARQCLRAVVEKLG